MKTNNKEALLDIYEACYFIGNHQLDKLEFYDWGSWRREKSVCAALKLLYNDAKCRLNPEKNND